MSNTQATVEDLIDELTDVLEKGWHLPFAGGKSFIDSEDDQVSHEAVCVLNTSDRNAVVSLTLYFEDREPMTGFTAECNAGRTHHIRLDRIVSENGEKIPRDTPYALLVESTEPVVAQYSRLDTSAVEMALMTTIAYPVE